MKKLTLNILFAALLANSFGLMAVEKNRSSCGCDIPKFTADVLFEKCPGKEKMEPKEPTAFAKFLINNEKAIDFSVGFLVGAACELIVAHSLKTADKLNLPGNGRYAAMIPAAYIGAIISVAAFDKIFARFDAFKREHGVKRKNQCCGAHNLDNINGLGTGFVTAALVMIGKSVKDKYFA